MWIVEFTLPVFETKHWENYTNIFRKVCGDYFDEICLKLLWIAFHVLHHELGLSFRWKFEGAFIVLSNLIHIILQKFFEHKYKLYTFFVFMNVQVISFLGRILPSLTSSYYKGNKWNTNLANNSLHWDDGFCFHQGRRPWNGTTSAE